MNNDIMTLEDAIARIKAYQLWRRGADIRQTNPRELGIALDLVIEAAEEFASMVSE